MRLTTLTPTGSHPTSRSTSVALSGELTAFQWEMIRLLEILMNLTDRAQITDLRHAYSKYKAILQARTTRIWMQNDGSWNIKKPTSEELTGIFVSKRDWHSKYATLFPKAKDYPLLMEWLENGMDAPANTKVFGMEKTVYTFKNLTEFFGMAEEAASKKGKGKRKAKGSVSEGGQKKKKGKAKKDSASEQSSDSV
jgi:hypothetical protein